jgi:hypothetical protein
MSRSPKNGTSNVVPKIRRHEVVAVYGAALAQGVALVTFPAASVVFTSGADYGLSNSQYGAMFLPRPLHHPCSAQAWRVA